MTKTITLSDRELRALRSGELSIEVAGVDGSRHGLLIDFVPEAVLTPDAERKKSPGQFLTPDESCRAIREIRAEAVA